MGDHDKHPSQPPSPPPDRGERDTNKGWRDPDWNRQTSYPPLEKVDTPEPWPGPTPKDKK